MKVFISWSGKRSGDIAQIMVEWFEAIFPTGLDLWCSSDDMRPGVLSVTQILDELQRSDQGIFCFTKDNTRSLWMMFEAGAISKKSDMDSDLGVNTIIFEGDVDCLKETPLEHFQHTLFNKVSMIKLFKKVNASINATYRLGEKILERNFNTQWNIYHNKIKEKLVILPSKNTEEVVNPFGGYIDGGKTVNKEQLMAQLNENDFGQPQLGQIIHYEKGFEDFPLYKILMENATERLWILGRKNRKVFDNTNNEHLEQIEVRIKGNLDFRCLFLDPDSPDEILSSAQDIEDFSERLRMCIKTAFDKVKAMGSVPADIIRLYSGIRENAIIIIDDVLLYSPILYKDAKPSAKESKPKPLTKAAFYLVSIEEEIGQKYLLHFEEVWKKANPLSVRPELQKTKT